MRMGDLESVYAVYAYGWSWVSNAYSHTHTNTSADTRTHANTQAYTHTYTDTLTKKHKHTHTHTRTSWSGRHLVENHRVVHYKVASVSRINKIIGLFCKRALLKRRYSVQEAYLQKRRYSAKETYQKRHTVAIIWWWLMSSYYCFMWSLGTHLKTASITFASECRFEPVDVPALWLRTNRAFCKAIRLFLMESLE